MFVTLSEDAEELRASIECHGWSPEGIDILELIASEDSLKADARYTMYHPADVELAEHRKSVLAAADRIKPLRVVFDSLSELRLLAGARCVIGDKITAIKRYFARHQATVMLIDRWGGGRTRDTQLHSLVHGGSSVFERLQGEYGSRSAPPLADRQAAGTVKYTKVSVDFVIRHDGIEIFPGSLLYRTSDFARAGGHLSNVKRLDAILGGSLAKGTSTLIVGAAGAGKVVAGDCSSPSRRRGGGSAQRCICSTKRLPPLPSVRLAWEWTSRRSSRPTR